MGLSEIEVVEVQGAFVVHGNFVSVVRFFWTELDDVGLALYYRKLYTLIFINIEGFNIISNCLSNYFAIENSTYIVQWFCGRKMLSHDGLDDSVRK